MNPFRTVLSARERQVMGFALADYRNKEIASAMRIGESTVHTHLHRLFKKLGVRNKKEAIARLMGRKLSRSLNWPGMHPPRTLRELRRRFRTNETCREYLFALRWPGGFRCPHCQGSSSWRTGRGLWLCQTCHRQMSVTAGTIFHDTHIPLPVLFRIAWEVSSGNQLASASRLMRVTGIGSYKTAWAWLKTFEAARRQHGFLRVRAAASRAANGFTASCSRPCKLGAAAHGKAAGKLSQRDNPAGAKQAPSYSQSRSASRRACP
jgi:DNA-binding CsgD family transcriptional regulator/ribosomal protein L37AE/L43A